MCGRSFIWSLQNDYLRLFGHPPFLPREFIYFPKPPPVSNPPALLLLILINRGASLSSLALVPRSHQIVHSLDVLGHPAEPLAVPHALDHGTHEHLDRPHVCRLKINLPFARGVVRQAEAVAELLLGRRVGDVDLVTQNQERHLPEGVVGEQRVKFLFALGKALFVNSVDEKDDCVDFGVVVFPDSARHLVTAEVESLELDLADGQLLLRSRVCVWWVRQRVSHIAGVMMMTEKDGGFLCVREAAGARGF